jgi:hypothetical protein
METAIQSCDEYATSYPGETFVVREYYPNAPLHTAHVEAA